MGEIIVSAGQSVSVGADGSTTVSSGAAPNTDWQKGIVVGKEIPSIGAAAAATGESTPGMGAADALDLKAASLITGQKLHSSPTQQATDLLQNAYRQMQSAANTAVMKGDDAQNVEHGIGLAKDYNTKWLTEQKDETTKKAKQVIEEAQKFVQQMSSQNVSSTSIEVAGGNATQIEGQVVNEVTGMISSGAISVGTTIQLMTMDNPPANLPSKPTTSKSEKSGIQEMLKNAVSEAQDAVSSVEGMSTSNSQQWAGLTSETQSMMQAALGKTVGGMLDALTKTGVGGLLNGKLGDMLGGKLGDVLGGGLGNFVKGKLGSVLGDKVGGVLNGKIGDVLNGALDKVGGGALSKALGSNLSGVISGKLGNIGGNLGGFDLNKVLSPISGAVDKSVSSAFNKLETSFGDVGSIVGANFDASSLGQRVAGMQDLVQNNASGIIKNVTSASSYSNIFDTQKLLKVASSENPNLIRDMGISTAVTNISSGNWNAFGATVKDKMVNTVSGRVAQEMGGLITRGSVSPVKSKVIRSVQDNVKGTFNSYISRTGGAFKMSPDIMGSLLQNNMSGIMDDNVMGIISQGGGINSAMNMMQNKTSALSQELTLSLTSKMSGNAPAVINKVMNMYNKKSSGVVDNLVSSMLNKTGQSSIGSINIATQEDVKNLPSMVRSLVRSKNVTGHVKVVVDSVSPKPELISYGNVLNSPSITRVSAVQANTSTVIGADGSVTVRPMTDAERAKIQAENNRIAKALGQA